MTDTEHPTADHGSCEWWPAEDVPATTVPGEGCDNRAVLLVGANGTWRLCEACAALPRFARSKVVRLESVDLMAALKASLNQARARAVSAREAGKETTA